MHLFACMLSFHMYISIWYLYTLHVLEAPQPAKQLISLHHLSQSLRGTVGWLTSSGLKCAILWWRADRKDRKLGASHMHTKTLKQYGYSQPFRFVDATSIRSIDKVLSFLKPSIFLMLSGTLASPSARPGHLCKLWKTSPHIIRMPCLLFKHR